MYDDNCTEIDFDAALAMLRGWLGSNVIGHVLGAGTVVLNFHGELGLDPQSIEHPELHTHWFTIGASKTSRPRVKVGGVRFHLAHDTATAIDVDEDGLLRFWLDDEAAIGIALLDRDQ